MKNKRFWGYMYLIVGTALVLGLGMAGSARSEAVMKQDVKTGNELYRDRVTDLEQTENGYCLSGKTVKVLSEDSARTIRAYMEMKEKEIAEEYGVSIKKIREDGIWLEYPDRESMFYKQEGVQTDNSSYYLIYDEELSGDSEKDFMGRVADMEIVLADEDGDYCFRVNDGCFVLSRDGEILE